ncbi:WRKY DNA-binding protein 48, putative isoform 2 [Hibiscus syriacus]|uniref:WRKY DNA-binding protein 48, putative isoform 2 n=1 Tax=Hibiscus syriacus TaxID=106335 RepID=A0A6A2Z226_HIBSY|nr:WRKY DNA-binding protein 48, putative isoform 2 [Hibiscus syriacus]
MEKKQENPMANMIFNDEIPPPAFGGGGAGNIFDMAGTSCEASGGDGGDKWGSSLGFMDLLGIHQDFVAPSLFDSFNQSPILPPPSSAELSAVFNHHHRHDLLLNELDSNTKHLYQGSLLSPATSAVPESSEMEKVWSKSCEEQPLSQELLSLHYCRCGVKKRVERSSDDPTTVVTTYEGQHIHPCPIMPRGTIGSAVDSSSFCAPSFVVPQPQYLHHHHQQQQHQQLQPYIYTSSASLNITTMSSNLTHNPSFNCFFQEKPRFNNPNPSALSLRDHGLLQDIVPTPMRIEAKEDDH